MRPVTAQELIAWVEDYIEQCDDAGEAGVILEACVAFIKALEKDNEPRE